jgi:post-GPI attachment to proteins factor 3
MFLSLLLQLALTIILVSASTGDRSKLFTDCVTYCVQNDSNCKLSLVLQVTRWTCFDDCRYQCMHSITDIAIEYGTRIHQYFGKWPFIRLLGMQEPASVLFSIFNLLAHVQGVILVKNKIRDGHPMKLLYIGWAFVSINAWIWSSIFHTRGTCGMILI